MPYDFLGHVTVTAPADSEIVKWFELGMASFMNVVFDAWRHWVDCKKFTKACLAAGESIHSICIRQPLEGTGCSLYQFNPKFIDVRDPGLGALIGVPDGAQSNVRVGSTLDMRDPGFSASAAPAASSSPAASASAASSSPAASTSTGPSGKSQPKKP